MSACSKEKPQTTNPEQQNSHETNNVVNQTQEESDGLKGETDSIQSGEVVQDDAEQTVIKKSVIPEEVSERPVINECSVDVDNDGVEERVVLGANLWVGPDGGYEQNDGQMWSLYVVDGNEGYLIFDKYINIGAPYYQVCHYLTEKGNEVQINVITEDAAGFYVDGYRYSEEQGGFVAKRRYDSNDESTDGISIYHSSIPWYSPEK